MFQGNFKSFGGRSGELKLVEPRPPLEQRVERLERVIAELVGVEARKHFGRDLLQFALDHTPDDPP